LKYVHPDTHFVFPLSNIKNDKDEERFKAEILKSWRAFLLEQPFGTLDDWTNYYGGEDKQALISREESREIVKSLSLKPFESAYKIMIIWQPELMHPSAANGILKILEEPPPHTFFILVTNAGDRLLPTILSRTQIVTVPLLHDDNVIEYLHDHLQVDQTRAAKIATLTDGNLPAAIRLSQGEEDDNSKQFIEWMRACLKNDYGTLLSKADEYHQADKLSQKNLMVHGMNMMRETLLNNAGAKEILRSTGEDLTFVEKFGTVLNDVKKIEKSFQLMNEASYHLERNGSAKMIFMDLSIKLATIIQLKN
jgi:DNA polymerase-3 subunit delta'